MKIPYNHLHVQGDILFAARGGKIHSFNLLDASYISTWKHPDVDKVASAVKAIAEAGKETKAPEEEADPEVEESEPPAKRQRLGEDGDASIAVENVQADAATKSQNEGRRKGKKSKKANHDGRPHISRVPDRPVITQMTSSADGAHLLAITGHDKNIWVFEHDGRGHISQLSQRTMPKRPSSVVIAPDSQIICADKFGDVYSLPLIPSAAPPSSTTANSLTSLSVSKPAYKPAANIFTVHSKRNLAALSNQQRQIEEARAKGEEVGKADVPDFELSLLLGHVSMLTALVLAESEGRRYILTGDRDEHIRISRYIPHAHIIDGFCSGHSEFVSSMVIPRARGDILVSGGGDPDLFVWDWKAGTLLSTVSVLSLVQAISPEAAKVAISGLYTLSYPSESGALTYVLAICEDVNAIFSWQLTDENILNHPGAIQLPGRPLHLAVSSANGESPNIIVAIDPGEAVPTKTLHIFSLTMSDGRLAVDTDSSVKDDSQDADEMDVLENEVRGLLLTVENLRKIRSTDAAVGAGEDGEEAEADVGDASEVAA